MKLSRGWKIIFLFFYFFFYFCFIIHSFIIFLPLFVLRSLMRCERLKCCNFTEIPSESQKIKKNFKTFALFLWLLIFSIWLYSNKYLFTQELYLVRDIHVIVSIFYLFFFFNNLWLLSKQIFIWFLFWFSITFTFYIVCVSNEVKFKYSLHIFGIHGLKQDLGDLQQSTEYFELSVDYRRIGEIKGQRLLR